MNNALVLLLSGTLLMLSACDSNDDADDQGQGDLDQCDIAFEIKDVSVGDGTEAVLGKSAVVHYEGFLCDASAADNKGTKFDSSVDRGVPFDFIVGAGRVIQGWDEGVPGMKVGGHRVLTIPPEKAYGTQGIQDVIPPNATLIFEIDLVDVR